MTIYLMKELYNIDKDPHNPLWGVYQEEGIRYQTEDVIDVDGGVWNFEGRENLNYQKKFWREDCRFD